MVPKVARLQFHTEACTRENKYEGRYPFKEGSSEYQGKQQRYSTLEGQNMAMKDNSKGHNNERRQNKRRRQYTQGDQEKHDKGERSYSSIGKERQSNLGRRWSGIHGRKNLCTKQQEDKGRNLEGKP